MVSCQTESGEDQSQNNVYGNPPAEGFNLEASDEQAIQLADSVMEAMGGRKAWDDLQYVSWNFFGARDLLWDKKGNRVRIDFPSKKAVYLLDMDDMSGKVMMDSVEVTQPDSLNKYLEEAKSIWINDSYWLFMPFKLKDSGVTLRYAGKDTMQNGQEAEVVKLTFDGVGVTPDNMYKVYISPKDHLVYQWAYYRDAAQDSASAVWPWDNYQKYGELLLSADRSDKRGPGQVRIYQQVDDEAFSTFSKPSLE
jgi:hypothetical protein